MKFYSESVVLVIGVSLAGCEKDYKNTSAHPTKEVASITRTALPSYPSWSNAFMGKTVDVALKTPGDCEGAFDVVKKRHVGQQGGVEVEGWGWINTQKRPPSQILFLNNSGVVEGAGETMVNRPDVKAAIPAITDTKVGWHGEIGATQGIFTAFALRPDSTLCPLGSKDVGDEAS